MFITELLIKIAVYFVGILVACFVGYIVKTFVEEIVEDINEFKRYRKSNKRNN